MYIPSPCYGCTAETGRSPGCKPGCARHLAWELAVIDEKTKTAEGRRRFNGYNSYVVQACERSARYRRKHSRQ